MINKYYLHKKGGVYKVISIAIHSENKTEMVVYRSMDDGGYWVRPKEMFNDGRFKEISFFHLIYLRIFEFFH